MLTPFILAQVSEADLNFWPLVHAVVTTLLVGSVAVGLLVVARRLMARGRPSRPRARRLDPLDLVVSWGIAAVVNYYAMQINLNNGWDYFWWQINFLIIYAGPILPGLAAGAALLWALTRRRARQAIARGNVDT